MDPAFPEVFDPWWDIRQEDEYTDDLEWASVHSVILEEKE